MFGDLLLVAEQDRHGDPFVDQDLGGAQDLFFLPLGEDHPLGCGLGLVDQGTHDLLGAPLERLEVLLVLLHVLDGASRHAAVHGRLGHRRGDVEQHPRIEGFGNQVLAAEADLDVAVGLAHRVGDVLLGEVGQRQTGGHLHLVVDRRGVNVERTAEQEGKAEHVVDLVGIVAAAGTDNDVVAHCLGLVRGDLRVGVGHGEDDRVLGHRFDHLRGHGALGGDAEEDVGPDHGLFKGAQGGVVGQARLVVVHPFGASLVDDPLGVAGVEVFRLGAEHQRHVGAGDARRPGAVDDDLDVLDLLADHCQGVDQAGVGDDRGAVLVVVEDRDVHDLLQLFLDIEALGPLDVLEVDAAEGRLQQLDGTNDLVRILGVEFDVEDVDIGEALEENALAFHDRLAGHGADIAKTEDRRTVGNDRHEIAFGGILVGHQRVLFDLQAGLGDAGAVGQRQVAAGGAGLGGDDFDLSFTPGTVIVQGVLTF